MLLCIGVLGFLWLVRGILLPFIIAFVVSVLLEPTVRRLRMRGWPKWLAVGSIFGIFILGLVALSIWLIPAVTGQVTGLKNRIEEVTTSVTKADDNANFFVRWNPVIAVRAAANDPIEKWFDSNSVLLERVGLPTTKQMIMSQYVEPQRAQISGYFQTFIRGFFGVATGLLVQGLMLVFVLILTPMMLMNMDRIKQRSALWIPPSIRDSAISMMNDIGEVFTNYLRGVTIAVLCYMALMSVVFSILGAPYGILLGILVGAVYLIPYLCVAISASTLILATGLSGQTGHQFLHLQSSWVFAGIVLASYLIVHYIYDSTVFPRVVGSAVGLDPIVSIFVSFSGGALFGVVGMIIAYPLAGAVKIVLDRLIRVTSGTGQIIKLPIIPLRHRGASGS